MTCCIIELLNGACLRNASHLKSCRLPPSSQFSEITCRHKNANLNSSTHFEFPDNFPSVIFVILSRTLIFPQHEASTKRVNQGCLVTCKQRLFLIFMAYSYFPSFFQIEIVAKIAALNSEEIWSFSFHFPPLLCMCLFEVVRERFVVSHRDSACKLVTRFDCL